MPSNAVAVSQKLETEQDIATQCAEVASHLIKLNVNFLALDFDQTIIDIHTGGRFSGTASELATHVRPMFFHLISASHKVGIQLAVVTFSPQTEQIAHVLDIHFPAFAHEIVIRGRDRTWDYVGNGMKEGKQPYMSSAAEELQAKSELDITRNTTLLVDDDPNNIHMALKDGVRGILLNPRKSHLLLQDILKMQ